MATELLISSDPWENRVAVLEDGQLSEIYFERDEKVIGSIFKGKVQNVLPGMGASFVDIGLGRNAFLYVDDINKTPLNIGDVEITSGRSGYTISEKVERGDDVLVQIVKEPRGLKGARISTNISLPGRYLILMPTGKYSGVSRKIESADERNRLKGIMKLIRPEGMATVVRTAAGGVSQAELIADLGVLIRMWHGILESYKRAPAPSLIHKDMNLVYKAARDFISPDVDRVLVDNAEEYEKIREFLRLLGPQYVERIKLHEGGRSLFKDFKVDEEVQRLMRPKVNLPSGGSIVIETTEALTVIDVNSGKFTGGRNLEDTIVKTNIEAAAEIARQVRLRDIGGIIVCDFIDMNTENSRNKVISTLEAGLRKDRTRSTIQSFSALGLLEFTRKRVGKDLAGQLRGPCPTCTGIGSVMSPETVAIETFRSLRRVGDARATKDAKKAIEARVAPTVGAQLEYWYEDELAQLEATLESKIAVHVDATLHPERSLVGLVGDIEKQLEVRVPRVGDEFDVDVLQTRLPNAAAGAAVIAGRLVEIEGAGSALGQTIKVKILDIDDDGRVLAETVTPVATPGEGKRRRRRGGRGRAKPLTAAEEAEELRELAEEAAKGIGARPIIGISTTSEAEAEDLENRTAAVANAAASSAAPSVPSNVIPLRIDGQDLERGYVMGEPGDVRRKRRRRRRRRPGTGDGAVAGVAAQTQEPTTASAAPAVGVVSELQAIPGGAVGEDAVRRKRRRRRRRGRGSVGPDGMPLSNGEFVAIPDRQIFEVGSTGETVATGQTAPPEPNRAIRTLERKSASVAVDAPPRSLSVADEAPKVTKPTRRRRTATAEEPVLPIVAAKATAALPAETGTTPKRGRPRKAVAEESAPVAVAEKPKRGRPKKAATDADAPVAAPKARAKKTTATKAAAPKKLASNGVASAAKKTAAKKTTRKKSA